MAKQFISVIWRMWNRDQREIDPDLWTQLHIEEGEPVIELNRPSEPSWRNARIVLCELERRSYGEPGDPDATESYHNAVRTTFDRIAVWLDSRPAEVVQKLQSSGTRMDLFIGLWIDDDQVDLSFPPSLLQACGKLNLPIEIISND